MIFSGDDTPLRENSQNNRLEENKKSVIFSNKDFVVDNTYTLSGLSEEQRKEADALAANPAQAKQVAQKFLSEIPTVYLKQTKEGTPVLNNDFYLKSAFIYKKLSNLAEFNALATTSKVSKNTGKNSLFSDYLTLIDREKSSRSLGYTRNTSAYNNPNEIKTIDFSNGFLTAKDSIGNVHYFLPLFDINFTPLARYSTLRKKIVDYIFTVTEWYDLWFQHVSSSENKKDQKDDSQKSRSLTTFSKDDLQQLQNVLSGAFKNFTKANSEPLKDLNLDGLNVTLYTGNYVMAESLIQQYKKLKEATPEQDKKAQRAKYDAEKWQNIQASRYGAFNSPSNIELQIFVSLNPPKEKAENLKNNETSSFEKIKNTFKKKESVSSGELLKSIFSDDPLRFIEDVEAPINLYNEANENEGESLGNPSSENTDVEKPKTPILTTDLLKKMRKDLVDYLNAHANKINTTVGNQKISTKIIYDIGKDENVQVKDDLHGFFTIKVIKDKSSQKLGNKIGNALKTGLGVVSAIQPVTSGGY